MKNRFAKFGVICCLTLIFYSECKAQIFEHADQKSNVEDEEVFQHGEIFKNKKTVEKRSSGGATFDSNMTFGGNIPIDGGLSIFVTGLFGYGIKKLRNRKHLKNV